ncbi:MAG: hypothetical protein M3010_05725, partial [Candidatus Dormibacteraeota bacterium]|nr:hypothetical protein [Candidatus Dormibacteraeota bacterium]
IYCAVHAVRRRSYPAALIVVAFLAAWLPFSRVTRVMFLYHMFGGLPFMILAVAFAMSRLRHARLRLSVGGALLPALEGRQLVFAYLALVVLAFVFFYPLWAGVPVTGDQWTQRIWFNLATDTKISWI